jgi:glycosyltransferase involved in cell wall biosynthesis
MSVRLSVAMIVRNEEGVLARILDDANTFCDELVVVDTGSTDGTVALAQEHGATVSHFEWIDDFGAARNFAFDRCTGDWILWLDADERIPPAAQLGFKALKHDLQSRQDIDAVMIAARRGFSDVDPTVCTFSFNRERVIRRSAGLRWAGVVHEVIAVPAGRSMIFTDAWVEHRPTPDSRVGKGDRNLHILEKATAKGDRSPRTLFYYANELRDHGMHREARATYAEYAKVSDVAWERHAALLSMARCSEALGDEIAKIGYLQDAIALDSTRAEAWNMFGLHHYNKGEWAQAMPFFVAATSLTRPADGFISDVDYTCLPWDYLAICLARLGRHRQALEATFRAADTSPDRERLRANAVMAVNELIAPPDSLGP